MNKFDAVLWNLTETRDIYLNRVKVAKHPKVKEYLQKRADEFNEAILIIKAGNVT